MSSCNPLKLNILSLIAKLLKREKIMYKVIVAGSRGFRNYKLLSAELDKFLKDIKDDIQIVDGKARGADDMGHRYALEKGYSWKRFAADWDNLDAPGAIIKTNKYGKKYNAKAGIDRNGDMRDYSDAAVVFRVDMSTGSTDMINKMRRAKKDVKVCDT